jgi:hypothetical protein
MEDTPLGEWWGYSLSLGVWGELGTEHEDEYDGGTRGEPVNG